MVSYTYGPVRDPEFIASATGPVFHPYATLRVWAYGFSDSTAMLGIGVALMGAACVFFQLILAII
jgi:hypothetical protein